MKRKILFGATAWLVLITVLHVHLNVGWGGLVSAVRVAVGWERGEMIVGFLPVT